MGRSTGDDGRRGTPQPFARLYVNHLQLLVELSDIRIDFGQLQPGSAVPAHPVHLVASPHFLLTMQREIGGAVERYQRQFGAIANDSPGGAHG